MSPVVEQLIEYNTQDVVKIIMEERNCPASEAMREFYSSKVFDGLSDPETGLYLESPSYPYELYKGLRELAHECEMRRREGVLCGHERVARGECVTLEQARAIVD